MPKKYVCNLCNYSTDRQYDFQKHARTKKHISKAIHSKVSINYAGASKNDANICKKVTELICEHCGKISSHRNNIARHYKNCNKYKEHLIKHEKNKIIDNLKNQLMQKNDSLKQYIKKTDTLKNKLNKSQKDVLHKDEIIYNLVIKLNDITSKYNKITNLKPKQRIKKQRIPATVRNTI